MLGLSQGSAVFASELSEQDYFSELPTILTVTRLAQPLSDTPGAVTIIDRETIRRSGARELADVLRLVPGYLVGGRNGANPMVAYHVPLDSYGKRNLVLIDGRPVYSSFMLGDTLRGLMGVLLDDIERIEVLRGSNSAAYGANAMLGVVNIITRHAADTRGGEVAIAGGTGDTADRYVRMGWGSDTAHFRLSAGRRSDSGYLNAHDDKRIDQLHFRGDLHPAADQELMFSAGAVDRSSGDGYPLGTRDNRLGGDALRTIDYRNLFVHGQWRRYLSPTDEIRLTANFDEENFDDDYLYAFDPSVTVNWGGRGRRLNLEFQHQIGISADLRAVWGIGYKRESVHSPHLYGTTASITYHEERLFGNLEWRLHPRWVINAGGFWGRHSEVGSYFSPRLMANYQIAPDHTLRFGVTNSARLPTFFELSSDLSYYPKNSLGWPVMTNLYTLLAALNMPYRQMVASGTAGPERLLTQEIGYFGNFQSWRMTLDLRAYVEKMRDLIDERERILPGYVLPPNTPIPVKDYANGPGFRASGIEYQLRWKPWNDTEIWLNQNFSRLVWDVAGTSVVRDDYLPPARMATVALFQRLPHGFDFSVMYHSIGGMNWGANPKDALPARDRVDLRLARSFRIGTTRAEAALTIQAANGDYPEYYLRKNFVSERRAFGTLRLEF